MNETPPLFFIQSTQDPNLYLRPGDKPGHLTMKPGKQRAGVYTKETGDEILKAIPGLGKLVPVTKDETKSIHIIKL